MVFSSNFESVEIRFYAIIVTQVSSDCAIVTFGLSYSCQDGVKVFGKREFSLSEMSSQV